VLEKRSQQLERIDTGDYTRAEYELFLREIRFINRVLGDDAALRKTLLREIEGSNMREFSVLDVGAGSGELLRTIALFARRTERKARLCGLDLNEISARSIYAESLEFGEIGAVRGDGLKLPFADESFDYAICSLFTHHLTDENVVKLLAEMRRVSRLGIYVIDLHRHPLAYRLYKIFCAAFRISPLVREDGLLSILRSFKPAELKNLGEKAGLESVSVERRLPFRLVLKGN
jgi:ubiquinone/menaquinone biosynthesis C-methylase UbiE